MMVKGIFCRRRGGSKQLKQAYAGLALPDPLGRCIYDAQLEFAHPTESAAGQSRWRAAAPRTTPEALARR